MKNYRKEKKSLKKLLAEAKKVQDERPLSHSANYLVRLLERELKELKDSKNIKPYY